MQITPSRPSRRGPRIALAAALLAGTALAGFAAGNAGLAASGPAAAPAAPVQAPPVTGLPDFTGLVASVHAAVVSVTTMLKVHNTAMVGPGPQMPFPFPFPFRMVPGGPMQPGPMQGQPVEARGSGFLISADGYIVTNNHVVKNARSISVTLTDGTRLPARIVGTDPRTDLALLKIDAGRPLPYVLLGDSNKARPGQWVVAMGNPFGLGGTVTAGIVSALGRNIGDGPYDKFIQTDAPINEGNSGGPLFNQKGHVIGVDTAIISPSGGSVGIGFAIPSDTVRTVIAQLRKSGHVVRGYLGVEAQLITPAMADALGLSHGNAEPSGALIASVEPGSPAARAGLQPGDVIAAVDGQKIGNPQDLAVDIAAIKPGRTASVRYLRNGKQRVARIALAELPTSLGGAAPAGPAAHARVGLALAPITPDVRRQLNLPGSVDGALVAGVAPGSPAAAAGIEPGDVVVGVGTGAVHSATEAADAIRAAERHGAKALALRILHHGQPGFVAIELGNGPKAG